MLRLLNWEVSSTTAKGAGTLKLELVVGAAVMKVAREKMTVIMVVECILLACLLVLLSEVEADVDNLQEQEKTDDVN